MSPKLSLSLLVLGSLASLVVLPLMNTAYAEDVIFIVPGAGDPSRQLDFDPQLQIISNDQAIVFVNSDFVNHHLVAKTVDGNEVFDTGVLDNTQFVSHTFTEFGKYSLQCELFPHMRGDIIVTDDIATFTKTINEQNLEVQLTRSPANPGVGDETLFKVVFIDKETGRNHPHIDYTLNFNNSEGNFVDGMGGHTVDGAEFGSFTFDEEDAFTPEVTVSGVNFLPIQPAASVQFETVVTPEFPPAIIGGTIAAVIAATIALSRRKFR